MHKILTEMSLHTVIDSVEVSISVCVIMCYDLLALILCTLAKRDFNAMAIFS